MKKICLTIILSLLLLISGCTISQNTTTNSSTTTTESSMTTSEQTTTTIQDDTISNVINVIDYNDNRSVIVVGVITAIDEWGNFFVQDSTGGIYVSGSNQLGLTLDKSFIGNEVKILGVKKVVNEIIQIELQSLDSIETLNQQGVMPNPLIVSDFSTLNLYEGRLITLINVNIGEKLENATQIKNQNRSVIARFFGGPNVSNRDFVDVTGVFYHSSTAGDLIIINNNGDVVESVYITDENKLNKAYNQFTIPNEITLDYLLPNRYDDEIMISWTTDSKDVLIKDNYIEKLNNLTTNLTINLVARMSIGSELSIEKEFTVKLVEETYWSLALTENFYYDGPQFPTEDLSVDFWNRGGGLLKVDFIGCVDGDTAYFYVTQPEGSKERETVRFFAVDTEETHHPKLGAEEWGYPASDYTCHILTNGSNFYLESDTVDGPRGVHGRLLGWIWVDGQLLQYNLISLGLAEAKYTRFTGEPATYDILLEEEEADAKARHVGKWSNLLDPYWDYEENAPKGW
ncbi:thermonuclease family protein [Mycoplasmatota bacterium]|nr:thermonuclease family protein [Mycoplasmatota bacterium]